MTVSSNSVRKTPWLAIILGVLAVLCLCAVVIGIAILAYITPIQGSSVHTTLTILDITRTADDIVANDSVLNTTPPEGEEFMQV